MKKPSVPSFGTKKDEDKKKRGKWPFLLLLLVLLLVPLLLKSCSPEGVSLVGCTQEKALSVAKNYVLEGKTKGKFSWDQVQVIKVGFREDAPLDPALKYMEYTPERLTRQSNEVKNRVIKQDIWNIVFFLDSPHSVDFNYNEATDHLRALVNADTCEILNFTYASHIDVSYDDVVEISESDWP